MIDRAFDSWVLPVLGFFLLPWTTLAYVVMWDVGTREVSGFEWFIVGLAFLMDLAVLLRWQAGSRLGPRARSRAATTR